jgi:hypothetical protein
VVVTLVFAHKKLTVLLDLGVINSNNQLSNTPKDDGYIAYLRVVIYNSVAFKSCDNGKWAIR